MTRPEAGSTTQLGGPQVLSDEPGITSVRRGSPPIVHWRAICVGIVGVLVLLDTIRVLHSFGFVFTDDDISVKWYAAEEFLRGRVREPFFYGQSYDTLAVSVPGAAFVGLGFSPAQAVAIATTAVGLLPWLLLSRLAWRRGAENLALLIAAGPLLLPDSYTFLLNKDFHSGVLAVTVAIVLVDRDGSAWRFFAFGLLVIVGVVILYPNSVVLGAPAVVYVGITQWRRWRRYAAIGAGAACGMALYIAGRAFYWRNPGWIVHPAPATDWRLHNVASGLRHLDTFMSWFAPWFAPFAGVDVAALAVIFSVALWRRSWLVAGTAATAGVTVVVTLGFDKVHDGLTNVFFPLQRAYAALPIAIAFLAILAVRSRSRLDARWAGAVVLIAFAGFSFRQLTLDHAVATSGFDTPGVTSPRTVSSLDAECSRILEVAQAQGAELVVDVFDRGLTYGCGAIDYGRVLTLYPAYERRTWRLEEERMARRTVVLFSEASPPLCETASARGYTCMLIAGTPTIAVVHTPPMSPIELIAELGIPVRAFS